MLIIDADKRLKIVAAANTEAWESEPNYLHSGPLLLLNGVRQPLDGKNWCVVLSMGMVINSLYIVG